PFRDSRHSRDQRDRCALAYPEEIAKGRLDTGRLRAVPVHADDHIAEGIRACLVFLTRWWKRDPNVFDAARSCDVREHGRLSGRQGNGRSPLPRGPEVAGGLAALSLFAIRVFGRNGERLPIGYKRQTPQAHEQVILGESTFLGYQER